MWTSDAGSESQRHITNVVPRRVPTQRQRVDVQPQRAPASGHRTSEQGRQLLERHVVPQSSHTAADALSDVHLTVGYDFPFSLHLWRGYAIVAVCLSFFLNVSRIIAKLIGRFHRNLVIGPTNQSKELIDFRR